jgi:hypothetical protein
MSGNPGKTPDHVEPTRADLFHLDIDLRIGVDTWLALWRSDSEEHALAALLRVVYACGYDDALTEPRRGQLRRDHGLAVPRRR